MQVNAQKVGELIWTGGERILVQVICFVQSVALARLLCPRDFGLTALLGLFMGVGTLLAESGLSSALVALGSRASNIQDLERRAFRWNVCVSFVFYLGFALISPLLARFYNEPVLMPIVCAQGLAVVVLAVGVVSHARLTRNLCFRALAVSNVVATLTSSVVGVALAVLGCAVWSIVAVTLTFSLVRTSLMLCSARRVPQSSSGEDMPFRALLSYGGKLTVSGVLYSIYFNSFGFILGRLFSPATVGLFVRGQRWAQLPGQVVSAAVERVSLARMSREGGVGSARSYLLLTCGVLWPLIVVLWVWAPGIVGFILGAGWLDCVPCLRILLVGALFAPISVIAANVMKVCGAADAVLRGDMVKLPCYVLFLVVGCFGGIAGICWAKVAGDVLGASVDACLALRVARCNHQAEMVQ